jgi:5'-deoxynucleotidase YfbR-like HD superfamily hydrolase
MKTPTTRDEILSEMKKLQFFYGLKREIRFGENRTDETNPESVAEHIYGMHVLFDYFLPLEDPEGKLNTERIRKMVTFHDIDEVITGDIVGYLKTEDDKKAEAAATVTILKNAPDSMRATLTDILEEYETRESTESKFVKALDKIEPVVQIFNQQGKELLNRMGTTRGQHDSIKKPFFEGFPVIDSFYSVVIEEMDKEGFFSKEEA